MEELWSLKILHSLNGGDLLQTLCHRDPHLPRHIRTGSNIPVGAAEDTTLRLNISQSFPNLGLVITLHKRRPL